MHKLHSLKNTFGSMLSDTRQEFPIATATTVTTTTPTTDFDSTRPLAQQQPQQHSSSLSTKRREKKCQRKHRCSNGNGRWSLFATTLLYWALFALVALCCSSGGANARHILLQQQPQYLRAYQRGAAEYYPIEVPKRSNAELINGLIGMDLGRLNAMGKRSFSTEPVGSLEKRSNAELINGLIGMDLNRLSAVG